MTIVGFSVVYNNEDYIAVAAKDNSFITVYKDASEVMLLTPERVNFMFWNGIPKNITLEVAVMLAYREIYTQEEDK